MRVVVVGAGLAGLTAARMLHDVHDVVVVDKGRGVGGRMATRRIGDATLDHGAQFFTTHTQEFASVVEAWEAAGIARPWFRGRVGPSGIDDADGADDVSDVERHTRFRGTDSMSSIAKWLAVGLDVRVSSPVTAVAHESNGNGWVVSVGDSVQRADAVLLTAPVPQSLALLEAGGVVLADDDLTSLRAISYEPCIAMLAVMDAPTRLPEPGAVQPGGEPIGWMADNQRKGVSTAPAVTIHATAGFSREHWDSPDATVIDLLLTAAALGSSPLVGSVQVHRWRFARPVHVHPARHLAAQGLASLLFAGDAFGGAKVEGAVLSGRSAGAALTLLAHEVR